MAHLDSKELTIDKEKIIDEIKRLREFQTCDPMSFTSGLIFKKRCKFEDLDQMKEENGVTVATDNALYVCEDGKWLLLEYFVDVKFKIIDRGRIVGRGYYTIFENPEKVPITLDSKVLVFREQETAREVRIVGIDRIPHWTKMSVFTNERIEGDEVVIRIK